MSAESRALYEIIRAESREAYEIRFLEHKKEVMDVVRASVEDAGRRFAELNDNIDAVHADVGAEIAEAKSSIDADLEAAKRQISTEIAGMSATLDRVILTMPRRDTAATAAGQQGVNAAGPVGHRSATTYPGRGCGFHMPPPGGGEESALKTNSLSATVRSYLNSDASVSAPRVELPAFEGSNPRLWKRRCEEYF